MILKFVLDASEAEKLQVAFEAFHDSGDAHIPILSRQLRLFVGIFEVLEETIRGEKDRLDNVQQD